MITILFFVLLFIFSAGFSGSESGIFSLKSSFKENLRDREDLFSRSLLIILENKGSILIVILVGNLLVNTFLSSAASEMAMKMFGESGLAWSVPLITILIIIFGEIIPKSLALKNAETVAIFVSPFLRILWFLMGPLTRLLQWISDQILIRLSNPALERDVQMNAEELSTMISIGEKEGVFNRWEKKLVEQIVTFREVYALERMTPRPDIIAVEKNTPRAEILRIVETTRRSKIPVYEEELDQVVGYLQAKDLLLFPEKPMDELMRNVLVIPEMKPMDLLLEDMQNKNVKMAILLDEYGSLQGLLTLEDVLETIFGELDGSSDKAQKKMREISKNHYIVGGQLSWRELEQTLDVDLLDEEIEPGTNVASYMMAELNKLPQVGDQVQKSRFLLKVKKLLKRRIVEVELTVSESDIDLDREDA